jgi:hypothetical protein
MEPDADAEVDVLDFFHAFNDRARSSGKPAVSFSCFLTAVHQCAFVCNAVRTDPKNPNRISGQRLKKSTSDT